MTTVNTTPSAAVLNLRKRRAEIAHAKARFAFWCNLHAAAPSRNAEAIAANRMELWGNRLERLEAKFRADEEFSAALAEDCFQMVEEREQATCSHWWELGFCADCHAQDPQAATMAADVAEHAAIGDHTGHALALRELLLRVGLYETREQAYATACW